MTDIDLAALLCSRLCHDLVGPVGAIGNGVEILQEEDDAEMQRQAAELLAHSAEQAAGRLKFYRLAFGASGGAGARVTLAEAREALEDLLRGGRVSLEWPDEDVAPARQPAKAGVKLLVNMALIAVESMSRGGRLTVGLMPDSAAVTASVQAAGAGVQLGDAVAAALRPEASPEGLEAKAAPALLAARLSGAMDARLRAEPGPDRLELTARLPLS